jgi:hypothetical protein
MKGSPFKTLSPLALCDKSPLITGRLEMSPSLSEGYSLVRWDHPSTRTSRSDLLPYSSYPPLRQADALAYNGSSPCGPLDGVAPLSPEGPLSATLLRDQSSDCSFYWLQLLDPHDCERFLSAILVLISR